MSYLEIILPFGIPPANLAKELVRQMKTPSLAMLLGFARRQQLHVHDEFSRQLPHERWIIRETAIPTNAINGPALAHQRMSNYGLPTEPGFWFILSPVHIHIARDHMVMTDQRRLAISEDESKALFAAAKEICEELGKALLYGDAKTWFLRADEWQSLSTASLDAAAGHNMEIWIAKGEHERAWRKLQNEIQMLWHIHPVNLARESHGDSCINSVWLHSGSAEIHAINYLQNIPNFNTFLERSKQSVFQRVLLEDLLEAALNNDWGNWLSLINQLEIDWFEPILQALKNKQIEEVRLILSDDQRLSEMSFRAPQSWKIWRKPGLESLLQLAMRTEVST